MGSLYDSLFKGSNLITPKSEIKVSKIQHRPMKPKHDDDYVSEDELDKISGDSISLYTCEMPEERLAKIKALMMKTNVYNMNNPISVQQCPLSGPLQGKGSKKKDFTEIGL